MTRGTVRGRGWSFEIAGLAPHAERSRSTDEDALHILVIADCSGRAARGVNESLVGRRAQRVDVERLERVIEGWQARVPTLLADSTGAPFWFEPRSLDHLHPDQLLAAAAPLAELAGLRASLARDPGAAARLSLLLAQPAAAAEAAPSAGAASAAAADPTRLDDFGPAAATGASAGESSADILSRLLGGATPPSLTPPSLTVPSVASPSLTQPSLTQPSLTQPSLSSPPIPERSEARPASGRVDIDHFIRAIVANAGAGIVAPSNRAGDAAAVGAAGAAGGSPPLSPAAMAALTSATDAELARRLRGLLQSPAVRALEATWRGIDGLCRHNPDEARVRVSVLDASLGELATNREPLLSLLEATAPDVVLLDHIATPEPDSLRSLAACLEVCRARDVALLAGAHPHLAGCAHFNELSQPEEEGVVLPELARDAWARLLAARDGDARLGLVLPRFILRQPYGASGEPIESFAFEELVDAADHEAFPWGNGAYLLARALCVQHAAERGVHPDGSIGLRELPVVYLDGDAEAGVESRIKPNTESWLSERSLGRLRAAGFSVLAGQRDTDRVRVYP